MPINKFSYIRAFLYLYTGSYKAIFFLWDTFTYFNYFSIRDSLWVERFFPCQIKRQRNFLLYTRISRKSQVNSFTANARFIRKIEIRFSVFSWMYFSSIHVHITTCSIPICAKLFFSINTNHCNKLCMCPNRIKSDLYINGGGSGRRWGADQIGTSIVNTLIKDSNHYVSLNLLNEKKLFIVNLFLNINQFLLRTKCVYHIYHF